MTLQILNYEFLGPIRLAEWGPPMAEILFLILTKNNEVFEILYAGESARTEDVNFFTTHEKFKCWISYASELNLHLSIYPMWDSEYGHRKRILDKIIEKYHPKCNSDNTNII